MRQRTSIKRRLLSFLITLAMVAGLLPGVSLAVYAEELTETINTVQDPGSYYYEGQYVTITGDFCDSDGLDIGHGRSITIEALAGGIIDSVSFSVSYGEEYANQTYSTAGTVNWTNGSSSGSITDINASTVTINNNNNTNSWIQFYLITVKMKAALGSRVTLNKRAATLTVGQTETLTATVSLDDATDMSVRWDVEGTDADAVKLYSDAECTTEIGEDATETLTVYARGESVGTATVTVVSNADSSLAASCDVTVNAPLAPVSYLDWDETTGTLVEKTGDEACTDYTVVDENTTSLANGWYVVNRDVIIEKDLSVSNDVNLILCDNAELTIVKGLEASFSDHLVIYAQSTGENMGALNFLSDDSSNSFGGLLSNNLIINGGHITAVGKLFGLICNNLMIRNGVVEASCTESGAMFGIGSQENIVIDGGVVNAASTCGIRCSGTLTINGGTVTANGTSQSGINCYSNVVINGGELTASGAYMAIQLESNDGTSAVINAIPGTGWTDMEGTQGEAAIAISEDGQTFDNFKKVMFRLVHVHSFTYTAENDVITATCANTDGKCELPENKVTLTINAPTLTVAGETGEGISAEATLTGLDEFMEATGLSDDPEIYYYIAEKSNGVYDIVTPYGEIPSETAGDYIAEVSIMTGGGYVYASVGYTIEAAVEPVAYLDWDETTETLVEKTGDEACTDYIVVTEETNRFEDGKWYVVNRDVTVQDMIVSSGNVHLILCDNAELTVTDEIVAPNQNGSFVIHAQSEGENMGALTSGGGIGDSGYVTINGGSVKTQGTIKGSEVTINGGTVEVNVQGSNGIHAQNTLTVNGGNITVNGGDQAFYTTKNIDINGGSITTNGNNKGIYANGRINISDGKITCTCKNGIHSGAGGKVLISGGSITINAAMDGIIAMAGTEISGGSITITGTQNYGISSFGGSIDINGGSITTTGYRAGIFCSGNMTVDGGTVKSVATSTDSQCISGIYAGSLAINGGSVTAVGNNGSIRKNVKNALAGAGWTDMEGTQGETAIPVNTEGQTLENYKKVVIPYVHTHTFGENPRWQWSFIDGKPVVTVNYTCSCGETEEVTPTVTGAESSDHSKITYTAVDKYENTDSRTYDLTFTVTYGEETYSYKFGDTCKLTADEVSDWYVEGVLRAEGTKTFYFPVTGNVEVTATPNEEAAQQVARISMTDVQSGSKKFSSKIFWSLPEGAKVKSTMIYRCRDDNFERTTAEALLAASNLRSFNMKLNARNGQFAYEATNLTSGSKQTVMAQVVYTLNGKTFTIHTEPQSVAIQ